MEQRASINLASRLENKVCTWFAQFKNGSEDLNDDSRPGYPEVSDRAELVKKVRDIITNMPVRKLTEALNSTTFTIWAILSEDWLQLKIVGNALTGSKQRSGFEWLVVVNNVSIDLSNGIAMVRNIITVFQVNNSRLNEC
ncbi:hypothetical protein FQA39_LY01661 [Lamprigera yunnana]|nr:hypothetical protein FQA39_LY01661 [Lamprigera yunnana]